MTPEVYRPGDRIYFEALNARRCGAVVSTGPLRLRVVYRTITTGATFHRYVPVTDKRLTPQAVARIAASFDQLARAARVQEPVTP